MSHIHLTAALSLFAATLTGSVSAATLLTNGAETNNSVWASGAHGVDFTTTTTMQLTALGFWDSGADGLANSYSIALWQTSTQLLLASVTITSADLLDQSLTVQGGQWRYEFFTAPVYLASGTTYTMGFLNPANLPANDSLFLNYPTVTTASTVTIINQRRFLNTGVLTFPTNTFSGDSSYMGQINAKLVPEPGIAGLLSLGTLGLLNRRRISRGQ